jgi:hypothetical protein
MPTVGTWTECAYWPRFGHCIQKKRRETSNPLVWGRVVLRPWTKRTPLKQLGGRGAEERFTRFINSVERQMNLGRCSLNLEWQEPEGPTLQGRLFL